MNNFKELKIRLLNTPGYIKLGSHQKSTPHCNSATCLGPTAASIKQTQLAITEINSGTTKSRSSRS